jgi:hypothetical protein
VGGRKNGRPAYKPSHDEVWRCLQLAAAATRRCLFYQHAEPTCGTGNLKKVERLPNCLSITIEHGGNVFPGYTLWIDDTTVLPKLCTFLQSHIDEDLKVIELLKIDL